MGTFINCVEIGWKIFIFLGNKGNMTSKVNTAYNKSSCDIKINSFNFPFEAG